MDPMQDARERSAVATRRNETAVRVIVAVFWTIVTVICIAVVAVLIFALQRASALTNT